MITICEIYEEVLEAVRNSHSLSYKWYITLQFTSHLCNKFVNENNITTMVARLQESWLCSLVDDDHGEALYIVATN